MCRHFFNRTTFLKFYNELYPFILFQVVLRISTEQKKSEVSSDATPTHMDPSEVTLLGRVRTDKPSSVESTPTKKKKHSDGSPKSSK